MARDGDVLSKGHWAQLPQQMALPSTREVMHRELCVLALILLGSQLGWACRLPQWTQLQVTLH